MTPQEYAALTDEQRDEYMRRFVCIHPEDYPIVKTELGYQMLHRDTGQPYWRVE